MNRYKIVFSDIDGTLLDSTLQIPPKTRECIRNLSAQSVPFILVSGRMPVSVKNIQKKLGISAPFISYSGALIRSEKGETLWDKPMPLATAAALKHEITAHFPSVISYVFSADIWVTDRDDGTAALYLEKEALQMTPLVGLPEKVLPETAPAHKLLCTGEPEILDKIQEYLQPQFPSCRIYKSQPRYLEIMSMEASKSAAAGFLCGKMSLTPKEALAFGDNFNDSDLLEFAGMGVAMGNSPQAVKDIADFVAPTNDEEGLRTVLEDIFFTP